MAHAKTPKSKRLDPRAPLVFDLRGLGPGSARSQSLVVPAPADLGAGMVRVPDGSSLELEVRLEDVSGGVLVTAGVVAPLAGECARCLEEFTSVANVRFVELFARESDNCDEDGYLLDGDLLNLEPALRDAVVLELPLSPLCASECQGLCSTCGVRLAEAEPGHGHGADGGVWSVLRELLPDGPQHPGSGAHAAGSAGPDQPKDGSLDGTTSPEGMKER
jgi:DUF177 domain-containing protein